MIENATHQGVREDRHPRSGLKVAHPSKVDSCNYLCRIALNPASLSKELFKAAVVRTDEAGTVGILLEAGMDANISRRYGLRVVWPTDTSATNR